MTYIVFAIGYIARPLCGILSAHFGDKHERENTFTLILNLMGVFSIFIGIFVPILLLLFRLTQGLASGGGESHVQQLIYMRLQKKRDGDLISRFSIQVWFLVHL